MFSRDHIPTQEDGEKVLLILRRHWFIFFRSIVLFLFLSILPLGIYFFIKAFAPDFFSSQLTQIIFILFFSAYYLMDLLLFFNNFVNYYLDVWIVTNKRILNIEQKALFNRTVSEEKISRIQDITSVVKGIIPTLLDFGDVDVQNASARERFVFEQVPHPSEVRKEIIEFLKANRHLEDPLDSEKEE